MTTALYAIPGSRYVRHAMAGVLGRYWWAWALPVAIGTLAAVLFDHVWFFAVLMLVCLLYPGLLMFVYIHYAFSAQAVSTTLPHTVTLTDKGLDVRFPDHPKFDCRYSVADIRDVSTGATEVVFKLSRPRYHHLAVPLDAVADPKAFVALAEKFRPVNPDV